MKKKIISLLAVAALGVQALAMPMLANAEESVSYVNHSDYSDVSIGGAGGQGPNGKGYYGLGIILDGSPWLSKGSASVHYQTFMYDEDTKRNYCNFWSNSDKSGGDDGAGSMYVYNRNLTNGNQMGPYGIAEFDIRTHEENGGSIGFWMGWFEDPTSGGFNPSSDIAVDLTISPESITAYDGKAIKNITAIKPEKWYTVRVTIDNKLEEFNVVVKDKETGAVIGNGEGLAYKASKPDGLFGIKTTCWAYLRGNKYNYDLTDVTIGKSDTKFPITAN